MRSLLFVPGDSERKLEKSVSSGADLLLIDLEDSVAADAKPAARDCALSFLQSNTGSDGPAVYVRVNALDTGMTDDDLAAIMPAKPAGIMLPKCSRRSDIEHLSAKLSVHEAEADKDDGSTRIIAIITETAAGVLAASSYNEPHRRLTGLTWGAEDLSADIGARAARDKDGQYTDIFRLARASTVLAACASETAAIDTVFVNFRDEDGLRRECEEAERDGFTAKMAIHPAQVSVINEVFTPSDEAIAHAKEIIETFQAAGNPGVVGLNGRMLDRPHLVRASRLLERAKSAGIPV